tara:strand:+ start:207 stop:359 length:153 start_codon:yes stop_codon:yes gene_type:complete
MNKSSFVMGMTFCGPTSLPYKVSEICQKMPAKARRSQEKAQKMLNMREKR